MKHIHSVKNPQIKEWKKLLTKKERDKTGTFLIEGFHLVEEALKKEGAILELIIQVEVDIPMKWDVGAIPITSVTEDVIKVLCDTEAPQGVVAICQQEQMDRTKVSGKTFLFIDAVQDPGNVGTMIRTADAAGIDVVVVGKGSVDIYNPKVLRSAQGSHFHLPIITDDLQPWLEKLIQAEIPGIRDSA